MLTGPKVAPFTGDKAEFIEKVRRALYLGKIVSYAQGFSQLKAASKENNWDLHYGEIAKIFRAGCIIRAQFLQKITDAYAADADIANLLLAPYFRKSPTNTSRRCVTWWLMPQNGIPTPTFSAAIATMTATLRGAAGEPDPCAARLLRRAHLQTHRQGRRVPYRMDGVILLVSEKPPPGGFFAKTSKNMHNAFSTLGCTIPTPNLALFLIFIF